PAGVALVPAPIEVLGHDPELNDEVVREVLRLRFASLLPPQAQKGGLFCPEDDPGVGAAYERAAISAVSHCIVHQNLRAYPSLNNIYDYNSQNSNSCQSIFDRFDQRRRMRHTQRMLTPAQCRAARGLLDWTQQTLANEAQVGIVTI